MKWEVHEVTWPCQNPAILSVVFGIREQDKGRRLGYLTQQKVQRELRNDDTAIA